MTNQDKARELMPCPFCGGEPEINEREDECLWSHNIVPWLSVGCQECSFEFDWPAGHDDPNAIKQWNTRAATHHQQEMLKRLDGVEVLEKFLRNLQQSTGVSLMKDFAEDVFTEIKKLLAEG